MDTRQQHNKAVSTDEWYTPTVDGRECDRRLRQSGIEGKYVVLNL